MAGQLFEISAETGRIGKAEGDGDFSHALGAGTEKILGLRDSSVIEIILIGQAHHLFEYSRKVGRRHAGLSGSVVETDIGSVVIVDKTNGLLDLMVLAGGDSGRRLSRLGRRIGSGKDVLSAPLIRLSEGEIEVDLRGKLGYTEGLLEVIAGAAPECLDRHFLVAVRRDDDNENGGRSVLDFFQDVDAGHVGQTVFDDREVNVFASLYPLDRNPAGLGRDDSIGVGKALDILVEEIGIVNEQYLSRYGFVLGWRTRVVSTLPAMLHIMVSRWLVDHCGLSAHAVLSRLRYSMVQEIYSENPLDRNPANSKFFSVCIVVTFLSFA